MIYLAIIIFVSLSFFIRDLLGDHHISLSYIMLGIETSLLMVLFFYSKKALTIIGENNIEDINPFRLISSSFVYLIFIFYFSLGYFVNTENSSIVSASLFIIAPALGAIISSIASNNRLNKQSRDELIKVSKKLIVSTILVLLAVSSLSILQLFGGINADVLSTGNEAMTRFFLFWIMGAPLFHGGIILFSLGIIDMIWAFRY